MKDAMDQPSHSKKNYTYDIKERTRPTFDGFPTNIYITYKIFY